MREVDNKISFGNVQQPKTEYKKVEEVVPSPSSNNARGVVEDLSNSHAEVVGRSQVDATSALEKAVAFGMKNPDKIAIADKAFNNFYTALQAKGDPEAYPKAAEMTEIYMNDFVNI